MIVLSEKMDRQRKRERESSDRQLVVLDVMKDAPMRAGEGDAASRFQ